MKQLEILERKYGYTCINSMCSYFLFIYLFLISWVEIMDHPEVRALKLHQFIYGKFVGELEGV